MNAPSIYNRIWFLLFIFFTTAINAPVGVNTITPNKTLDANGTAAVRVLTSNASTTTQLTGANNPSLLGGACAS
ncbi:hypothetical protein [uncultured Winogradskyella sp.]|uniref:hypothetical protein n=1 Tax=uncultured Winogradskyella sp. TaxID=395353 RepID=UPI002628DA93|nr:hypothetical protein [uncultured Winogradskyella sp.]